MNEPPSLPSRIGDYRIERVLGAGGMATVYLAERRGPEGFRKHVALKVIRSEFARDATFRAMLVKEAKIAQALSHGNVVQVFELGEADGTYFIAMEYVPGSTLQQLQRRAPERVLPVEIALYVTRCLCRALQHANTRRDRRGQPLGIVHRDVSPHNVLLTDDGQVKLADFGIAHALDRLSRSLPGTLKGKAGYLSPEQAAGSADIDHRSDIFSLGTVTYEMLTGQNPLHAASLTECLQRALNADFSRPSAVRSGLDERVDALVLRAVQKRPEERYTTAQQWLDELEAYRLAQQDGTDSAQMGDFVRELIGPPENAPVRSLDDALAQAIGDEATLAEAPPSTSVPTRETRAAGGTSLQPHGAAELVPSRRGGRWALIGVAALGAVALTIYASTREPTLPSTTHKPAVDRALAPPDATAVGRRIHRDSAVAADSGLTERPPARRKKQRGAGKLWVNLVPWARVSVDGRTLGETPQRVRLAAGRHRVLLVNPTLNLRKTMVVTIKPGEMTRVERW